MRHDRDISWLTLIFDYDGMVERISPLDLRRSLGRILDEASAGRRFLIERDHRPLAVLIPVEDAARLDESAEDAARRRKEAWDALRDYVERVRPMLDPDRPSAAQMVRQDREARDRRDQRRAAGDLRASVRYDEE
jgi:antitoxin (DNA-binding transcriptional repressor) of toxin-antitoxin stability system